MPNIATPGTYTKNTPGFEFLSATTRFTGEPRNQTLLFGGSSLGSSCVLNYVDDQGVSRPFEDGTIAALPRSMEIGHIEVDLEIIVAGSPDFNVTPGIK